MCYPNSFWTVSGKRVICIALTLADVWPRSAALVEKQLSRIFLLTWKPDHLFTLKTFPCWIKKNHLKWMLHATVQAAFCILHIIVAKLWRHDTAVAPCPWIQRVPSQINWLIIFFFFFCLLTGPAAVTACAGRFTLSPNLFQYSFGFMPNFFQVMFRTNHT